MDGTTRRDIWAAAQGILDRMAPLANRSLCVATVDRFGVAAAVVAAAQGALHLVLPHGLEPGQVDAACREQHCVAVLGDVAPELSGLTHLDLEDRPKKLDGQQLSSRNGTARISLHTGGSTGRPRVWHRTLRSMLKEAELLASHLEVVAQDRILATVSPLHIYGFMLSVLVPLGTGAQVVRRSSYYPREVEAMLHERACTMLAATPPHLRILSRSIGAPGNLRLVVSSGSMLPARDAERVHQRTGTRVVEIYGATETGVVATRCRAEGQTDWTALAGVDVRIEADRLAVRSEYLAQGLTVARDGFFRTGDLATLSAAKQGGIDADGFSLHGRVDGIVKVAGVRVDVLGVQEQIRLLPGVLDACVVSAAVDGPRENALQMVVVYDGPTAELQNALKQRLSPVECPRRILRLDQIPLSPPGKHDRQAVRALFETTGHEDADG